MVFIWYFDINEPLMKLGNDLMAAEQDAQSVKLIVDINEGGKDAFFLRAGEMYKELYLSDPEVEEYYISDDPIPESISGWIKLKIIKHNIDNQNFLELSYRGNGLSPKIVETLEKLKQWAHRELNSGTKNQLDLTPMLNSIGWIIALD